MNFCNSENNGFVGFECDEQKKKALQHDHDCSNRKSKGGDKENMHSETKENDSSKSNEFANECDGPLSGKNKENTDSKGKENDERNAKKKHKSKSKGKKSKGKSRLSKSMRRY